MFALYRPEEHGSHVFEKRLRKYFPGAHVLLLHWTTSGELASASHGLLYVSHLPAAHAMQLFLRVGSHFAVSNRSPLGHEYGAHFEPEAVAVPARKVLVGHG